MRRFSARGPPRAAPLPVAAARPQPAPVALAKAPQVAPTLTSEAYRKQFAERIVHASHEVFQEPLPRMLKSIVVLDVTLDRDGRLAALSVRRSNGFKALEHVAMNSIRRAAPFEAPPRSMQRHDGSVNFLETFLFRQDGRFQVRTLAEAQ